MKIFNTNYIKLIKQLHNGTYKCTVKEYGNIIRPSKLVVDGVNVYFDCGFNWYLRWKDSGRIWHEWNGIVEEIEIEIVTDSLHIGEF